MKVGIVIITYNLDSRIFILQIEAIRKFCRDENFQIHVFDNSDKVDVAKAIKYHAGKLNVPYKKTFSGSKDSSESHSFAANISYNILQDKFDYFLYLDHDCIPVKPFSVIETLGEKFVMAGLGQSSGDNTYFWPGYVMWNNKVIDKKLIDFFPDQGLDTGAGLRKVVQEYGEDRCIFFNESYCGNPHFKKGKYNFYSMINDESFMHFINSSNWNPTEDNGSRINSLINIATRRIEEYEDPR